VIVDTSVVLAVVQREPHWQQALEPLKAAAVLRMSAGTLQELLVVAHCRAVLPQVEAFLELLDLDVVPVDAELARRALVLFQRFGKGQGGKAQLNFGDCFAAALAERDQLPLAFVGTDFREAGF
jgi:ribonuclease VapC